MKRCSWLSQFWNMVILPCLSFIMSCYMLVSYWMDSESWTMLRRCLMFANVPMVVFFGTIFPYQCNAERHTNASQCGVLQAWCSQGNRSITRWVCLAKFRQ